MSLVNQFDFVADESVDATITQHLRQNGYSVYSIAESLPSVSDNIVLATAFNNNSVLITEDKDFGELVIRFKLPHVGVLLLRLIGLSANEKNILVLNAIKEHKTEMKDAFTVLDSTNLRIRSLK